MKNTAFCILTRGRADRQTTLHNIPTSLRSKTYLVVDAKEAKEHKEYNHLVRKILIMPKGWGNFDGNFSDKKQWVSEEIKERYLFILDDDLTFNYRDHGKLMKADKVDTRRGFKILSEWLNKGFAHVAMSPREGNNRVTESYTDNSRAMRVCGFDLKVIKKEGLKFNRTILMADFDITLCLLELGYPNRVLYDWANGQRKSNDEGGCSIYRTPDTMKQAAMSLHRLHPKYVKVEQKKTSKPWAGFETSVRTDVTVYWKKAFSGHRKGKGITDLLKGG